MSADSRFEGHIVQGHVDGVGQIKSKVKKGNSWLIGIRADSSFTKQLVEKGSVAIDGISLTVFNVKSGSFDISIIPLTIEKTTLGFKKTGDWINLEADIVGKYIKRFLKGE